MILCDQAKIIDIRARNYEFVEQAPTDIVLDAIDTVKGFIDVLGHN
jgi:hypothetical protein